VGLDPSLNAATAYAVTGGEARFNLPVSPTKPPATYAPDASNVLATIPIASPTRPFAGAMPAPQPPTTTTAARRLSLSLSAAALSVQSAPSAPAPARRSLTLSAAAARFTGATKDFNPIDAAKTELALPLPRLLLGGAMIAGGLMAGGVGRWVAVAGAALAGSAVWTYWKAKR
jgi:hypothetical protein